MSVLVFIVVSLLFYILYSYTVGKPHPKFPPGPLRWPIWGAYLEMLVRSYHWPHKALHWMSKRYGSEVIGLYLGPFSTVVACSQASVRELLLKPEFQGRVHAFIPKSRDSDGVIRGQFFPDGPLWVEQRRFMLRNLRDFGFGTRNKKLERVIEEEVRDFIHNVQSDVEGICRKGEVLVPQVFYSFFLNITMQLLLGVHMPSSLHSKLRGFAYQTLRFQRALDPTTGTINMTPWVRHFAPQWSGYTECKESNDLIKQFIREYVEEHKATFIQDSLRDYCDVYLRELKEKQSSDVEHWFSEEQLVLTFWDLLFPSAMAVTAVMTFAVEFMLHHPEVQVKVQQEIDEIVGRARLPTLDDRKNLHYTEAVMRESLRRETLTPLSLPHRCTEDTYFYGYYIPKDTVMLASLWSSHMDERTWENPLEFRPERHLDENGKLKKKDLTVPFGLGKHVCSGETYARQNMFLLFSAMMQHFTLELPTGHPMPDMKNHFTGVNTSPRPFHVNMVPR